MLEAFRISRSQLSEVLALTLCEKVNSHHLNQWLEVTHNFSGLKKYHGIGGTQIQIYTRVLTRKMPLPGFTLVLPGYDVEGRLRIN
jgi:hypothetical protein